MKKKQPHSNVPPAFNMRAAEQSLNDILTLIGGKEFSSVEEANAFLQGKLVTGGIPRAKARTPLEKAQELMYEAEVADPKHRLELAKQALALTPDCADAYIILAEITASHDIPAAVEYAREAVRAGELDRDDEFAALYTEYKDDGMASFTYSHALWLFRRDGSSPEACAALAEAVKCNPYVPGYLLFTRKIPSTLPDFHGIGDKNEAITYVSGAIESWVHTKGALFWLRTRCGRRLRR